MGSDLAARLPLLLVCVFLGMLLTWQAPMNAEASRRFASPALAALLSLTVSVLLVTVAAFATFRAWPSLANLGGAPWWMWVGGFCGAFFLIGSLIIVPRIGSLLFLLSVILGQMIGALAADGFGLFGLPVQHIAWGKIAGVGLVLAGAFVYHLGD